MLNRLKDGARITDHDPTFKARYVGRVETFTPAGTGCTTPLVQKLWDNSPEEHLLRRVQIRITTSGIHMKGLEKRKDQEELFIIENISFCTVDTAVNDRIFSWIYKDEKEFAHACHAVVCGSTETAKSMSLVLSRAFQIAYKEWKASQIRSERQDVKKQRSVSLGALALPKKHIRGQGQKSKSLKGPTENGSPTDRQTNVIHVNGLTRTLSEPLDTHNRKHSVEESSQTDSETIPLEAKHKEVGVQADTDTTHL